MCRINLTDDALSAIKKMSDGNIGAVTVLIKILEQGGKIDPDDFMGGLGGILSLDSLGIYGSRIWILYKDICGEDVSMMLAVLRSHQLGYLASKTLFDACQREDRSGREMVNPEEMYRKVKERLPNFNNG